MFHVLAYSLKGAPRNVYSSIDLQGNSHQFQLIPKRHQEYCAALPSSHASMRGEHACESIESLERPRLLAGPSKTSEGFVATPSELCKEKDVSESIRNGMNCNELSLTGLTITSDIYTSDILSF